jgi:hypothetical protein
VYGDQSLEGLHFVGLDRLNLHTTPEGLAGLVVPGVDNAGADMFALRGRLLDRCGFADVGGKLGLGLAEVDITGRTVRHGV